MTARWIVADVFDGLATLEDGSVDLVVTSPPFLALRSYLPADHPDKSREIGSEPTPAAFIDVMLAVTAELRRVLAPHGSICVELGDTYAGSGGAGGDYLENGLREGQPTWDSPSGRARSATTAERPTGPASSAARTAQESWRGIDVKNRGNTSRGTATRQRENRESWPLAKSKTLIPELYRIALAYSINPLTGQESPAGRWRVRNVVTWARPNPPVGALGDKWRPATSDVVVACISDKRYWDDIATRRPVQHPLKSATTAFDENGDRRRKLSPYNSEEQSANGAPLLDWWEIPPGGYKGSHYAVFPPALIEPLIKAMAPPKVCRTCGEPSRRIVTTQRTLDGEPVDDIGSIYADSPAGMSRAPQGNGHWRYATERQDLGWSDCGHDNYRPAHILDPFAGSGTTGVVATGHGHDVTLIDLDGRNRDLAYERIGPFLWEQVS